MSDRALVIQRIRAGLAAGGAPSAPSNATAPIAALRVAIVDRVQRFRDRAEALASTVIGPVAVDAIPDVVARYLGQHGLARAAVAWPDAARLDWAAQGISVRVGPARADDAVGITGVECAVAETGTLMLVSGPTTPASVSLLPETHIAVVPTARIVAYMEDGFTRVRAAGAMPRAINFVSGPSRTADIEQTVTVGAHGPYRVLVVLCEDELPT